MSTSPHASPGTEEGPPPEAFAAAMAGLRRMGPARLTALLAVMPPQDAWHRLCAGGSWDDAVVAQAIGPASHELVGAWRAEACEVDVAGLWRRTLDLGVGVTALGSAGYPAELAADVEPPAVLFHQGDLGLVDRPRVAIVGTRRCSATGRGLAFELGRDLAAAGVSVVSGLAAGIDGAAHRGALAGDGVPPIGVVGSGHDVVYPAQQQELWRTVADVGLLLSEAPPGARPERWRFPARNRIIAALADVVVVVESHARGGSLHTVDEADRRARDVFAVPGSVRNPAAAGTNALLAEGRAPACSAADVLVALGLGTGRRQRSPDARAEPLPADREVLEQVGWEAATLDQLVVRTGRDLGSLAPALDRLCDAGWVRRSGGWYERVAGTGMSRPPRARSVP
jgi:DNA processing protein